MPPGELQSVVGKVPAGDLRAPAAAAAAAPDVQLVICHAPFAGSYTVESTGVRYDCPQGIQLRVANYSLFALFAAAAVNEALITVLGLRGEHSIGGCTQLAGRGRNTGAEGGVGHAQGAAGSGLAAPA